MTSPQSKSFIITFENHNKHIPVKSKCLLSKERRVIRLNRAYIYTCFTLINHRDWSKITVWRIFSTALTVSMLINHRASTPKRASMQPECKECPVLDIDDYTWAWCAYWESNNFTWFWIKEYFHSRFGSSDLQKIDFQYSVFCNQIKLQLNRMAINNQKRFPTYKVTLYFEQQGWNHIACRNSSGEINCTR